MQQKESYKPTSGGTLPKRKAPQVQLWGITSKRMHGFLQEVFRHIKHQDQEDLCYALIAWIRFGIQRPFPSPFLQTIFLEFVKQLKQEKPIR